MTTGRGFAILFFVVTVAASSCGVGVDTPASDTSVSTPALTATDVEPFAQPANWSSSSTRGSNGTVMADVTGDGKADVVALGGSNITVYRSHGTFFSGVETWSSTAFNGTHGTFFADVTGDGAADAIEVNDTNVLMRPSTGGGTSFGAAQTWSTTAFFGTSGTFLADVTGDKKADLINVNANNILVRRATTSGFGAVETWSTTKFLGGRGTYFADVTGDGLADAITISASTVTVRRSTGSAFNTSAEVWSSSFSGGSVATAFVDVTGDGTADAVAVSNSGVTMQRSGRWYFGVSETMSSAFVPSGWAGFFGDVTGDGRADFIRMSSTLPTAVLVRQDRPIPLRVVQFVNSCADVRSDADFAPALADAYATYHEIGLNFFLQPVSQNPDCPGLSSHTHIVISPELASFGDNPGPDSAAALAKAKDAFNPSCDIGYSDFQDLPEITQIYWVGTRCALPGEVLIYMSSVNNATNDPGAGSLSAMDRWDALDVANGHFSHELGHYLGLPHSFEYYGSPLSYVDPRTAEGAARSVFWDLQSNGTTFFNNRAAAATQEMQLNPIEVFVDQPFLGQIMHLSAGWFCPSGDPTKPCPFSTLPGGNPPPSTLGMPIHGDTSNVIYTYLPQTTTFDSRMKGISPRLPGNTPAIDTMSYSYVPGDPPNLKRTISSSQIELIESALSTDIRTQVLDTSGHVIFGGRSRLGLTAAAPQLTYLSKPGLAKGTLGTLASNGQNTWTIGTVAAPSGGNQVFEWNYRTQVWGLMPGGAYQIALPSDGSNTPWIVTGGVPGSVQRWNGSAFAALPADPTGGCVHAIAVGPSSDGNPANAPLWVVSCYGPNGDGNYQIARYTDATGWQWTQGWGTQLAVDWTGSLYAMSAYNGGSAMMLWKATLGADGMPSTWAQVPPPSGVTPQILSGGSAQDGARLSVTFLGTNGHVYAYGLSTGVWGDNGAPPFAVAAMGGSLPYLWVEQTNGQIYLTR